MDESKAVLWFFGSNIMWISSSESSSQLLQPLHRHPQQLVLRAIDQLLTFLKIKMTTNSENPKTKDMIDTDNGVGPIELTWNWLKYEEVHVHTDIKVYILAEQEI